MAGKVLDLNDYITKDQLACQISEYWMDWDGRRQNWKADREEIQRYIFATDTTKTTNAQLPWSNKTTIPKLCQIRDNLFANYMATMFPRRNNIKWEGASKVDQDAEKTKAIESYMTWVTDQPEYYNEVAKLVLDYIDHGNLFVMPEWVDGRQMTDDKTKTQIGYAGPRLRRINPMDIVFNPIAPTFQDSPKIIRSILSLGEVKEMLERDAITPEDLETAKAIYNYMKDLRHGVSLQADNTFVQDAIYDIAGFDNFQAYLASNMVEVLTFYGDFYNIEADEFQRNKIIKVVDRHKLISNIDNPSFFGTAPIFHCGWRVRPDNLWGMGPLDNLVGMQYRIDHLENIKADIFDLIAYPVIAVTGYVEDFEWQPMERIILGDDGKVEMVAPKVEAMQANTEIAILEQKMEEMAGSPKEAMGFRTPGEKTKYEVQRMENAASRIFQNKIGQFEMQIIEPAQNAMLELARRNMDDTVIRIFDNELKIAVFKQLSPEDITGNGRIRPMAARHFAEQAQLVQDLNAFFASAIGQDQEVKLHFSTIKTARMFEDILDIEDYSLVEPFIRISERADAQHMMNVAQENTAVDSTTPSGMGADFDLQGNKPQAGVAPANPVQGPGKPQA